MPLLPTFPTAPGWFRPVLQAETVAIRVLYRGRHRAAESVPAGGVENFAYNDLVGYFASERLVPGSAPGWDVALHTARYTWAMGACVDKHVVDIGCGVGYGSSLLSWVAESVTSLDLSEAAVETARARYPEGDFRVGDATDAAQVPSGDIAVCFEVLEHVHAPEAVLDTLVARFPRALVSFPNPIFLGSHINPHHVNDWPLSTLLGKIRDRGARDVTVYHQNRRSTQVKRYGFPWNPTWLLDIRTR
jgi:2-polyprenyl-3-methyl-5-hydroxy-6-metoxy-1,4-benzoquinol methylase